MFFSKQRRNLRRQAAFTLVELMVGTALGSMAMGWIGLASVSLQRSYEAANYQMTAQNDQLRVLDYLSRDLRMAYTVTLLNDSSKVTMTLPPGDASIVSLNIGPLLNSLLGTAAATSTSAPATISYYVEGGQFIRELNGVQTVLGDTVALLQFTRSGAFMTTDVQFSPCFSNSPTTAAQANTKASNCTYLRNLASGS